MCEIRVSYTQCMRVESPEYLPVLETISRAFGLLIWKSPGLQVIQVGTSTLLTTVTVTTNLQSAVETAEAH